MDEKNRERHMLQTLRRCFLALAIAIAVAPAVVHAQTPASQVGIVIMHGKGGSPTKHVSDLASSLKGDGYLVANLEMPWSGSRNYDVGVGDGVKEVETALAGLRGQGAQKVFVAGHSQGGLFALHVGGKVAMDGVIAIAPGGNVASKDFRGKLGEYVEQARAMIAEGKGDEKTRFYDYESSKGVYPITTTPAIYAGWFDPDGAMNQSSAAANVGFNVPVLYVGPTRDYPGLVRIKRTTFAALPENSLHRLYEPDASHLEAPSASREEIVRWIGDVLSAKKPL
jgi:alpha-beta hydrolase superfamily lysophospholipase